MNGSLPALVFLQYIQAVQKIVNNKTCEQGLEDLHRSATGLRIFSESQHLFLMFLTSQAFLMTHISPQNLHTVSAETFHLQVLPASTVAVMLTHF